MASVNARKGGAAANHCDPLHRNLCSLPKATLSCGASTPGLSARLTPRFPWRVVPLHPGHGSCPTAGRSFGSSCGLFLWVTAEFLSVSDALVQNSHRSPAPILLGRRTVTFSTGSQALVPFRAQAGREGPSPAGRPGPGPGRAGLRAFPRRGHGRGTGSRLAGSCRSPRSRSGSGGIEDDG